MKRLVLLLLLLPSACGCGGVILSARYSRLLDETAAWTAEAADRAAAGRLDPNETAAALRRSAEHWRRFQQARDGKDDHETR